MLKRVRYKASVGDLLRTETLDGRWLSARGWWLIFPCLLIIRSMHIRAYIHTWPWLFHLQDVHGCAQRSSCRALFSQAGHKAPRLSFHLAAWEALLDRQRGRLESHGHGHGRSDVLRFHAPVKSHCFSTELLISSARGVHICVRAPTATTTFPASHRSVRRGAVASLYFHLLVHYP